MTHFCKPFGIIPWDPIGEPGSIIPLCPACELAWFGERLRISLDQRATIEAQGIALPPLPPREPGENDAQYFHRLQRMTLALLLAAPEEP